MKTPPSIEVQVAGLTIDPITNMPIVVLRDLAGKQQLPIWIGLVEASSIATQLEKIELARPMTHDLLKVFLQTTGATLEKVEISELKEDTFFANLHLTIDGKPVVLDSRPSDAIALALRTGSPIYVAQQVLDQSKRVERATSPQSSSNLPQPDDLMTQPPSKWAEMLEKLSPDSFKFKM